MTNSTNLSLSTNAAARLSPAKRQELTALKAGAAKFKLLLLSILAAFTVYLDLTAISGEDYFYSRGNIALQLAAVSVMVLLNIRRLVLSAGKVMRKEYDEELIYLVNVAVLYVFSALNAAIMLFGSNVTPDSALLFGLCAVIILCYNVYFYIMEKLRQKLHDRAHDNLIPSLNTVTVIKENDERQSKDVALIRQGDVISANPGDKIVADGVIVKGSTAVCEDALSASRFAVKKSVGDKVFAGTENVSALILYKAERGATAGLNADKFSDIKEMGERDNYKSFNGTVRKGLTELSLLTLIVAFIGASALFLSVYLKTNVSALAIAAFAAVLAAVYPFTKYQDLILLKTALAAGESGITFSGEDSIKRLAQAKVLALTVDELCQNQYTLSGVYSAPDAAKTDVFTYAAACLIGTDSEFKNLFISELSLREIDAPMLQSITARTEQGTAAVIGGSKVEVGSLVYFRSKADRAQYHALQTMCRKNLKRGEIEAAVFCDNMLLGVVAICQVIPEQIREYIDGIKAQGVKPLLLSRHSRSAALYAAGIAGIDDCHYELYDNKRQEIISGFRQNCTVAALKRAETKSSIDNADIDIYCTEEIGQNFKDITIVKGCFEEIKNAFSISAAALSGMRKITVYTVIYNVIALLAVFGAFGTEFLGNAFAAAAIMSMYSVFAAYKVTRQKTFFSAAS